MVNALTHVCTKVLSSADGSEPVKFNPKKLKMLRKIFKKLVVLHTISIKLCLEAKQLCVVQCTWNTSRDADPQQMLTIKCHMKKFLVEIRELHHQLKVAADTNGKDVIRVCSVWRVMGRV